MTTQIFASCLSQESQHCLLKLEHQLVRLQGFISLHSFEGEHAKQLQQWQQAGLVNLETDSLSEMPTEWIQQRGVTHGCQMSDELWKASACLRRILAHGL